MRKTVEISNTDFEKEIHFEGNEFDVYEIKQGGKTFHSVKSDKQSVCILLFDINDQGQIRRTYLNKAYNFLESEVQYSLLTEYYDEEEDDSFLDTAKRCLLEQLGILPNQLQFDDIYYLGEVSYNKIVSDKIRCYAINVSSLIKSPIGFEPNPTENSDIKLEPIRFREILKGDVNDALILASSMLLLSYFS